jgi:hypothetical protein
MTKKYTICVRKQIEVNTDPLRRRYNGCHFSSEIIWTEWNDLFSLNTLEEAEESMKLYQHINPGHQYKIVETEDV